MRKKYLQDKIQRLNKKIADMKARAQASQDVNEVRSIHEKIEEMNADVADAQAELDAITADEQQEQQRSAQTPPAGAAYVNGGFMNGGAFAQPAQQQAQGQQRSEEEDPLATMEYRRAFREYACRGTAMPLTQRNGEAINTGDTGAAIPMTIMNQVINTVRKRYGNLYSKVRKTSVPGGVEYPIGALSATFKWINE